MALWLNLANDTCKDASKLLALYVCSKLLSGIVLPLGGILPSHRKPYVLVCCLQQHEPAQRSQKQMIVCDTYYDHHHIHYGL